MSKTITFEWEGLDYTLEYTRASVKQMEQNGFRVAQVGDQPMTMLPMLFEGAFIARHKFTKPAVINAIYEAIDDKEGLIAKLIEMYNECLESLLDSPKTGKNLKWAAAW